MIEKGNLDDNGTINFLHLSLDRVEDIWVGYRFEYGQLSLISKNNRRQHRPIDSTFFDRLWPPISHLAESGTSAINDLVADAVGIYSDDSSRGKQFSHLALSRGKAATEDPTMLTSIHQPRR
jgi:hypothetical protein